MQKINKNSPSLPTKFVIFSHSISSLQAIYDFNIDNDLVQKFIKEYSVQTKQGKTITLCWIPSHVGIPGNENANSAAKGGLSLSVTALKSPASELLPCITKLISEKWQKSWNNCTGALEALRDALYKYSTTTTTTLYHRTLLIFSRCCHCTLLTMHARLCSGVQRNHMSG